MTLLWIFFKLPDFDQASGYIAGMFTPSVNPNPTKIFYNLALLYSLPVMIQHLPVTGHFKQWRSKAEPYLYGMLAALAFLEAGPESAFIYFQF